MTDRISKLQEVIIGEYRAGASVQSLKLKYHTATETIWEILNKNNVVRRTRSESTSRLALDRQAFSTLTDASAYWIGFLMADGSVWNFTSANARLSLILAIADKEHVIKFREFLKSEHTIYEHDKISFWEKENRQIVSRLCGITISSIELVNDLSKYGVVQNKTYTTTASKELELNTHFWRGVIDGDGCIGFYSKEKRVRLSLVGSENLVQQFVNFISFHTDSKCIVRPKDNIFAVEVSGNNAIKLLDVLYSDASTYLERKFQKYLAIKQSGMSFRHAVRKHQYVMPSIEFITNELKSGIPKYTLAKRYGIPDTTFMRYLKKNNIQSENRIG